MESSSCCTREQKTNIVYGCSGCADVGEVADQVSRKLRKDGFAAHKASCLAGIGAGLTAFIEAAKAADTIIAIDGCEIGCAQRLLEKAGFQVQKVVLTKMGLEKGKTIPSPELTNNLCRSIVNSFS